MRRIGEVLADRKLLEQVNAFNPEELMILNYIISKSKKSSNQIRIAPVFDERQVKNVCSKVIPDVKVKADSSGWICIFISKF